MIAIAIGSSIGAMLRYIFTLYADKRFLGHWAIFFVNVIGSFLFGLLVMTNENWTMFLCSGILGGFTTFSTFIMDTFQLIEKNTTGKAIFYVICSICCSFLACFVGIFLGGI